jgi:WD40 repeat protein
MRRAPGRIAVARSLDGDRLASGGGNDTVRLWDTGTATELCTLSAHTGPVNATN